MRHTPRAVLESVATAVLVLCAVTLTALLVRRETRQQSSTELIPARQTDWRQYVDSTRDSDVGSKLVQVVVFSDFQCPYCSVLHDRLKSLAAEYSHRVSFQWRHLPLPQHEAARPAALAAACAAMQAREQQMADWMFAHQDLLPRTDFVRAATLAGVQDSAQFRRCFERREQAAVITRDSVAAARLGVMGTPTFLVNEWRLTGVPGTSQLRAIIERVLKEGASND